MRSTQSSASDLALALVLASCSAGSPPSGGAAEVKTSVGGAQGQRALGGGFDAGAPHAGADASAAGSGGMRASATGAAGAAGHASGGVGGGGGGASGSGTGGGSGGTGGSGAPDAGAPQTIDHLVTFYGWPDNSPAGNGIAYPKIHQGASGTGTYADPITFASDPTEWPPGTKLYLPYLQRYVIMEDSCADCITDWKSGKRHIDVWLDSDGRVDSQVLACENALTRDKTAVEVMPPADRAVDATPLFDQTTGTCHAP